MYKKIIILNLNLIFILAFLSTKLLAQNANSFKLLSPNENTIFEVNNREGISWISSDSTRINIEYSLDEQNWNTIFDNVRSDIEHFGWRVPNSLGGKKIKLRVSNFNTSVKLFETDFWIYITVSNVFGSISKSANQENILRIL